MPTIVIRILYEHEKAQKNLANHIGAMAFSCHIRGGLQVAHLGFVPSDSATLIAGRAAFECTKVLDRILRRIKVWLRS